tara:strand:+ start:200 stop:1024 length:825 start_codon:yes stop_codon:yes gene_type:complete
MSNLLDEGALDDLASRLSDAAEAEPEAEVEAQPEAVEEVEEESPLEEDVSEEVEAASEEGSSPVDAEASEDGDEDDKGDDADGHAVPYKRFQKVIQARNSFREEGESLRQQIEELKAQVNQPKQARAPKEPVEEKDWLDEALEESQVPDQYEELNERLTRFEVSQQKALLEQELNSVLEQHPNVPRELLIQAVVQNPNENLNTVAERYSSYIAEVQEKAIAEHMKTVEVAPKKKKKAGPPRPKKTGAAKTEEAPKPLDRDSRYKAVQEAIARMT